MHSWVSACTRIGFVSSHVCICVCAFFFINVVVRRRRRRIHGSCRRHRVLCLQSLLFILLPQRMWKKGNANVPCIRNTNTTSSWHLHRHSTQAKSNMYCSFVCSLTRSIVRSFAWSFQCVSEKSNIRISFPKCMFWMRPSRNIQWLRLKATRRIYRHSAC